MNPGLPGHKANTLTIMPMSEHPKYLLKFVINIFQRLFLVCTIQKITQNKNFYKILLKFLELFKSYKIKIMTLCKKLIQ